MTPSQIAALAAASVVAGVVNSVAGGGSLVSFPAAMAVGLSPLVANATNAVALTPGSIAAAYAYRAEVARDPRALRVLLPPALLGGFSGSVLLLKTPQAVFDAVVPFLVLGATGLLVYQNLKPKSASAPGPNAQAFATPREAVMAALLQFAVGVYGGYFGAGMGIMMLAILARLGFTEIHAMNGLKSLLGTAINATAAVWFVAMHTVDATAACVMAVGAILGGFLGASVARRVPAVYIRWAVVALGVLLSAKLLVERWA